MRNGPRKQPPAAATSPRQSSQALARSIEDELLSASVNTPRAADTAHSSSGHSGRNSSATVRTVLNDGSADPTSNSVRGPLARAESRRAETSGKPAAAGATAAAAWNISFGGPSTAPGNKRRRKPSPQAASVRARLEGRSGATGTAPATAEAPETADAPVTAPPTASGAPARTVPQASGMPTPPAPPPRRRAVLLETPLFIREERAAAAAAAAAASEAPSSSPAPAHTSLFARGLSRLRSSPSVVIPIRESTVPGSRSRARRESQKGPKTRSSASPWDLSTIPSDSTRKRAHHQQQQQHRDDGASHRSYGSSSSVSSFSRKEMLQFLESSPTHHNTQSSAAAAPAAVASSSSTSAPGGAGVAQPMPTNRDARYAALSGISSSLADIVSSSRSSLRSSLAAGPPPPRVAGMATLMPAGNSHSSGSGGGGGGAGAGGSGTVRDRGSDHRVARSPTIMEPPDVSSIHGEEEIIRQRQLERLARHRRHQADPLAEPAPSHTVQLPTAHAHTEDAPRLPRTSDATRRGRTTTATERRSGAHGSRPSPLRARVATLCRLCFSALGVLFFVLCGVCLAAPMLVNLDNPQDTLTRYYVNPVSELHALYRVAPSSLSEDGVRRLYGRALSEGVERLERSTGHLTNVVRDATRADQLLYLQQLVRAYVAVQHHARLYARSRDESAWRRLVAYPLGDAWRFGLGRHGLRHTLRRLMRKPSWRYLTELGRGTVNCLAQNEELPCPTLLFVEQSMMILSAPDPENADDEESLVRDVNAGVETALGLRYRPRTSWPTLRRDWDSEIYLDTLLTFIRETIRQSTRDYNRPPSA